MAVAMVIVHVYLYYSKAPKESMLYASYCYLRLLTDFVISVSPSLSIYLSSLSVYLFLSDLLSLSFDHNVFMYVSLSLSLYRSISHSLSVSVYVLRLSVALSLSLCLSADRSSLFALSVYAIFIT